MEDDPVSKRARRAIGTVCDACGKQFSTALGYDQHRRSGYLRGTACHVGHNGTNRSQLVATSRATMSTAMLQKLKLSSSRRSHGTVVKRTLTYAAYVY